MPPAQHHPFQYHANTAPIVSGSMKVIDMQKHEVIDSGQTWPHVKKPCSKEMLPMLEQNESIITWVSPRGSTRTSDQFPVIRIKREYYSISLRMMKAIWR